MNPREALPRSWTDFLKGGMIGVGSDIGTTDKGTSNPSTISVIEKEGRFYRERLLIAWKTSDPDVSEEFYHLVLSDLQEFKMPARRLSLDASNETFFCKRLRKNLSKYCPVSLIKGGENLKYEGEEMPSKILLGNLYINAIEDGVLCLPAGEFIRDDHRLVSKDRGSFTTATNNAGQHGDTFDSGKLALWSLLTKSGKVEASAVDVRGGQGKTLRPGLIGSIAKKLFNRNNF